MKEPCSRSVCALITPTDSPSMWYTGPIQPASRRARYFMAGCGGGWLRDDRFDHGHRPVLAPIDELDAPAVLIQEEVELLVFIAAQHRLRLLQRLRAQLEADAGRAVTRDLERQRSRVGVGPFALLDLLLQLDHLSIDLVECQVERRLPAEVGLAGRGHRVPAPVHVDRQ